MTEDAPERLPAIAAEAQKLFKTSGVVARRLAGRLRTDDGRGAMERITRGFAAAERELAGPGGLFAAHAARLAASHRAASLRRDLAATEEEYARTLRGAETVAGQLNTTSRQAVTRGIANAL